MGADKHNLVSSNQELDSNDKCKSNRRYQEGINSAYFDQGSSLRDRPSALVLPFLNNFRNALFGKNWVLKSIASQFLQFPIAKCEIVPVKGIFVHVSREVLIINWRAAFP